MSVQQNNITKFCSFYVSDWHMVTMLLPYINKKMNEQTKIVTILEKGIEQNIKTLVNKLNLKNKEKILQLDWTSCNGKKYTTISKKIENVGKGDILIIVNGEKNFIDKVNVHIQTYLAKKKETIAEIKIVDCYDVIEFNDSIQEILEEHDKILNTSGEKEIEEVFEGFKRTSKEMKQEKIS